MDPIRVVDFILVMSGGIFAVLFSTGYGLSVTAASISRDLPRECLVVSYQDTASVASLLACFVTILVLCALIIKCIYKRTDNGNEEANLPMARRLVFALMSLAVITYFLAGILFVMVLQYRAGKIGCWSLATKVFVFGALFFTLIGGGILGVICCIYGTPPVPLAPVPLDPVPDDALHLAAGGGNE